MIIKSLTIRNNRNFINGVPLARFVWNHYNPTNIWSPGYFIHHKDNDTLNDHITNLQLVTPAEHNKIHSIGRKLSEEAKKKISEFNKGKTISDWQKKIISEYMKNRPVTTEIKNKISASLKGRFSGDKNPFYGMSHNEETKRKIAKANRGNTYCLGKPGPMKGKHHSNETINKMKNKFFSDEYKLKISEACKKAWIKRKALK